MNKKRIMAGVLAAAVAVGSNGVRVYAADGAKEEVIYIITDDLDDGAGKLSDGANEFYDKTDGMDEQVEDTMDEMLVSVSGDDSGVCSFVSDKNTNVESVQFVIKTSAIEKPKIVQIEEKELKKTGFWDKLCDLFGKL